MKRIIINIILIICFALLFFAAALPFLANIQFNKGISLEKIFRWNMADKKFDLTVRLNPLSAENNTAVGRLYAARARAIKDKAPVLLKAEVNLKRAYQLNPYDMVNLMELAALEKELFLANPALFKDRINNALGYCKEAFGKDPDNYLINYEIGRNYVELWEYIDDEHKKYAVERLKTCLRLAPLYYEGVYQILWRGFRDFNVLLTVTPENPAAYKNLYDFVVKYNLWEYRKEILGKIGGPPKRTATGLVWSGKSDDGGNIYTNGGMYWSGTASRIIETPKGRCLLKIKAKGEEAYGVWPYMIVELDGEEIGERSVNSDQWREYSFNVNTNGGVKILSVTFPNDAGDPKKRIDRNLYVGDVKIEVASSP
jgi:tetratricopeptide (TPR) repeat protein